MHQQPQFCYFNYLQQFGIKQIVVDRLILNHISSESVHMYENKNLQVS